MENIDEKDIVILTDEEGLEHQFIIVDMVEVETGVYAMLMPLQVESEDEDYYVIMKVVHEDGEDVLMTIEDDEEYESVSKVIEELYNEEDEGDQEVIDAL